MVFYIQYDHLPKGGKQVTVTDTMRIKFTTTGFRLLGYKFGVFDKFIKIDAASFRSRENLSYYTLSNHIHAGKVEEQLGEEVKVLDIAPDTLYIRPTALQPPGKS